MTQFNGGESGKHTALVNIGHEGPEWLEWCAALYESNAADHEWINGETYLTRPESTPVATWRQYGSRDYTMAQYADSLSSLDQYGRTAHRLAEQLERDVYGRQEAALYARKYVNGVEYVTPISSIVTRGEW